MRLPKGRRFNQLNEGEITGVLNSSQNMAYDTIGQAKLANRPVAVISSDQDDDFSHTLAIVYFSGSYTAVTSDRVFNGDLSGSTWTKEASFRPSTTLASDAIVFNNLLHVTTDDNLDTWNGGGSINDDRLGTSLTSGVPHPLAIFDSNPTFKLAVGNGNKVQTYNTSYNLNTTVLTLPSQFQVTTIRYRNGFLYIGTKTTDGTEARIFIWNGSGSNAQYECPVGAEWVFSMTEFGTTVAAVTSEGQIIQVQGSSYTQLAAFPVYHDPHTRWQGVGGLQLNGKVFNRGMVSIGQSLYINVEGETDTGFLPAMKSGLWVFDPEVGLYHRATPTTDLQTVDVEVTLTDNTITTTSPHLLETGDGVSFVTLSGISGINTKQTYYVSVISPTEFKLSATRQSLMQGEFETITGTPTASDKLVYFPNTDRGCTFDVTSGAVLSTSYNEAPLDMLSSEVIFGSRTLDQSGTTVYTMSAFHDSNTRGDFTLQREYSDNLTQTWEKIYPFVDGLITESDSVVVKASTAYEPQSNELQGFWKDTTTFNATSQPSALSDIKEGDEVIFTEKVGQGRTAHVVNIERSTNTFSITVDEEIGEAGGGVQFYTTNYSKVGEYTNEEKTKEYIKSVFADIDPSPWLKIKLELRGANLAINQIELDNEVNQSFE